MATVEQNANLLINTIRREIRESRIPALIGKTLSNGTVVTGREGSLAATGDYLGPTRCWVRLLGNEEDTVTALCVEVTPRANAPVVIQENFFGQYEVVGLDSSKAFEVYGANTGSIAVNLGDLSDTLALVGGNNFKPGRLRLAVASSLKVTVDDWLYFDTVGQIKQFRANDTVLDLTSNVPGTSGQQRYVLITLNPNATTPVLVATNGTAVSTGITLNPFVEGVAIRVPSGHYPLALVRLVNGDTTLTTGRMIDWRAYPNAQPERVRLFTQTADATVANTVTETTLFSTGVGTLDLPANRFEVGETVHIIMSGYLSTANPAGDLTVRVTLDGNEIVTTNVFTASNALVDDGWYLRVDLVCRSVGATGSVVGAGKFSYDQTIVNETKTTATTVDTTVPLTIDVTAQWGTADASNSITCQIASVDVVR